MKELTATFFGCLILLVIYFQFDYRLEQIEQRQEILLKAVNENHHALSEFVDEITLRGGE